MEGQVCDEGLAPSFPTTITRGQKQTSLAHGFPRQHPTRQLATWAHSLKLGWLEEPRPYREGIPVSPYPSLPPFIISFHLCVYS